jgi:hypothetical protein
MKLTKLSLFSGIGGDDLASEWAGIETVCFVEKDKYCQKVLKEHWPDIPIIEDVKDVTKKNSKPSQVENGLTLLAAETLANLKVLPDSEEARMMTAISGRRCSESCKSSSPLGLLTKTLLEDSHFHSTRCFLTWRVRVMKHKRSLFQLVPSTLGIDEIDSILLPTLTTPRPHDNENTVGMDYPTQHQYSLARFIKSVSLIPTLCASDYHSPNCGIHHLERKSRKQLRLNHWLYLLPTLTVNGNNNRIGASENSGTGLNTAIGNIAQLKLSPAFAEIHMGYPPKWTELKD